MDPIETMSENSKTPNPKDLEQGQSQKGTLYDELRQIADNNHQYGGEVVEKNNYKETVTKPESRRYGPDEEFVFMVHCPLDIQYRVAALGTEEFTLDDRPLNNSLIDSEHTFTFEGMSGLIIEPPSEEDILGAWSYDSGVNDLQSEPEVTGPKEVLEATRPDDYNQVNIRRGRVIGVFIRIREDGSEIGDTARNAELRKLAEQSGLPLAEIVVRPTRYPDEPPSVLSPQQGLTTIEFSLGGKKYRLDELLADPYRPVPGATTVEGYYLRVREVDEYGASGGDVVDSEAISLVLNQLSGIKRDSLRPDQIKALDVHVRFLQTIVNP